jgi:hypothetical protein
LHKAVRMAHSEISDNNVKTNLAMSHFTCLGENFPWSCHKVTYSWRKATELCPNDRVALKDVMQWSVLLIIESS